MKNETARIILINQRNRPVNDRDEIIFVLSTLLKDLDSSLEKHFKATGHQQTIKEVRDSNLNRDYVLGFSRERQKCNLAYRQAGKDGCSRGF